MSKHTVTGHRFHANYLDGEEQLSVPVWVWPLAAAVIALLLVVR
jgi:hypothetical protein